MALPFVKNMTNRSKLEVVTFMIYMVTADSGLAIKKSSYENNHAEELKKRQ